MSTRQNLGFRLIEQRRRRFATANSAPNQPTISAGTLTSSGATLTGSAFSDPDVGDTHAASQWQVTTAADTGYAAPVISTGDDATNKTSYAATGLSASTDYIARVRYKDSAGNYSDWSTSASFTTAASGATLPIGDDFTDTDGTTLDAHVPSGPNPGASWETTVGPAGDLKIRNGEVYQSTTTGSNRVELLHGAAAYGTNDYSVIGTIRFAGDPGSDVYFTGVVLRAPASGRGGYGLLITYAAGIPALKVQLVRLSTTADGTGDAFLKTVTVGPWSTYANTTKTFKITAAGATITCQIDGVDAFTATTDSTWTTGEAGILVWDSSGNSVNFGMYITKIDVTP